VGISSYPCLSVSTLSLPFLAIVTSLRVFPDSNYHSRRRSDRQDGIPLPQTPASAWRNRCGGRLRVGFHGAPYGETLWVKVTAFNLSHEQTVFARRRAREEGLIARVEFIEDDYRKHIRALRCLLVRGNAGARWIKRLCGLGQSHPPPSWRIRTRTSPLHRPEPRSPLSAWIQK
jgi:hypothetical protein